MQELKPNILIIGGWSSRCSSCGRGADMKELQHDSWIGYDASSIADQENIRYPLRGCGAEYKWVSYNDAGPLDRYEEFAREVCARHRPDLEFVSGYYA